MKMQGSGMEHRTTAQGSGERMRWPHDDVYVRLRPSGIHGIGVFAIRDIPEGTDVFGADDRPLVRVPAEPVHDLPADMRELYEDFCVLEHGEYWCPRSFNDLTISWYLNHSETPNVHSIEGLKFVAARHIRRGEELTADYRTYSEDSLPWITRPRLP
jgi:uncharacterized protein